MLLETKIVQKYVSTKKLFQSEGDLEYLQEEAIEYVLLNYNS